MAAHLANLRFWENQRQFKPNSVVVVTGGGSGIGKSVALAYAERSCRLALCDIRESSLAPVAARCRSLGAPQVEIKGVDVTDEKQVKVFIKAIADLYGGIDILVLCAGIGAHHLFHKITDLSIFDKLMKVNFFGYLYATKYAYPHLVKSQGVLVAVTSFSAEVGLPYRTAYCASKFAVTGFLESLRAEMSMLQRTSGSKGFAITLVCPPTINTNLRKHSLTTDPNLKGAKSKTALSVEEATAAIIDGADRRLKKVFFPWKSWAAAYFHPLAPDLVNKILAKRAKI